MPHRFGLFLLYYIVEESIEIKTHKINYFTNVSNWLDLVVIGVSKWTDQIRLSDSEFHLFHFQISGAQIFYIVYLQMQIPDILNALLKLPFQHADFSEMANKSVAVFAQNRWRYSFYSYRCLIGRQ